MQLIYRNDSRGFTLTELVIVILLIGVVATVATRKIGSSIETARYEQTKRELDELAYAIAGNAEAFADGARTDFGYIGDIGALPPNLDALVQNPGGYSTWNGPYVAGGFEADGFKKDAWEATYTYAGTLIRSTGSGSNIDKAFAINSTALLSNAVSGYLVDANSNLPGTVYRDSIIVRLTYPNGSGGTTTVSINPSAKGNFSFSNVPIGNHLLSVIYLPDTDTVTCRVSVEPNSSVKLDVVWPADLW